MTKIITSENRIIFDGHARTKEECETISLACEELAKSDKFRTVKYGSGYAEFEKIGKTDDLKFVAAYGRLLIYNATSTEVYKQDVYWGDGAMVVSLEGNKITFDKSGNNGVLFPQSAAAINTVNISVSAAGTSWSDNTKFEITLPYAPSKIRYFGGNDGMFASEYYDSGYSDVIINNGETVTLSSKNYGSGGGAAIQYYEEATPTISFKHRFKNDALIGTGTYKFRRYSVEEPVVAPEVTQSGTTLTIANASATQSGTEVTIT